LVDLPEYSRFQPVSRRRAREGVLEGGIVAFCAHFSETELRISRQLRYQCLRGDVIEMEPNTVEIAG
jgi:hypothetical protein